MNTKENNNGWKNRSKDNYNVERAQMLEALIEQHTPAIHAIVKRNMEEWGAWGANENPVCQKEDLVQECMLAIIRAYDSYSDDKGASLTTWIHNNIDWSAKDYLKNNFGTLGNTAYLFNVMQKVKKMGYEPTIENLVEFGGVSYQTAMASTYAFLRPGSAGGASSGLKRKDEVEELKQPEKAYCQKEFEDCFRLEYEKYLDPKESKVLASYYGLSGSAPKTMKEIGKDVGKSRKAVSYMIEKSLVKLRHQPGIEAYNIV